MRALGWSIPEGYGKAGSKAGACDTRCRRVLGADAVLCSGTSKPLSLSEPALSWGWPGGIVPLPGPGELLRAWTEAMGMGELLQAAGMLEMCRAGLGLADLIWQPMLRHCWHGSRHPLLPVNLLRCHMPKQFCQNPLELGPATDLLSNVVACWGRRLPPFRAGHGMSLGT